MFQNRDAPKFCFTHKKQANWGTPGHHYFETSPIRLYIYIHGSFKLGHHPIRTRFLQRYGFATGCMGFKKISDHQNFTWSCQ